MTPSDEQIRMAIAEQASEWFVENRGGPLDRGARSRFMAWLQTSPVHVGEYLSLVGLVRDLDTAANTTEIPLETLLARARAEADPVTMLNVSTPLPAPITTPRHRARDWSLAAAAALAVLAATLWLTRDGERFGLAKTYTTAHGEQSERVLPDGSVLHLNTDSEATVRYLRRERVLDVRRGEAFVLVAHESERRFRVAAGNAQILAVGTQFDVYRKSEAVLVTVVEGTVTVNTGPPQRTPSALPVGAGYQVEVGGQVGAPRPVDARAAVAWLKRQIAFEDEPLAEVAAEFNRYGGVVLEIDDDTIRALRISGVFDAYDTDSFAAFLETLHGVVVQKTPTRIRVRSVTAAYREQSAAR
jgi:transmembrane sensor